MAALIEEEQEFDPSQVPMFPVLSARVEESDEGASAWFDGEPLDLSDDADPFEAVIWSAREAAAKREGLVKAVRVRASVSGPAGDESWLLVVHEDGSRWDVDAPVVKRRPVSRGVLAGLLGLVAAAVAVVVLLGTLIVTHTGGDQAAATTPTVTVTPKPTATPTALPVLGPDGQVVTALWASAPVAQSGTRTAALVSGDELITVAAASSGAKVQAVDVATGAVRWSHRVSGASGAVLTAPRPGLVAAQWSQGAVVLNARTGKQVAAKSSPSAASVQPDSASVTGGVFLRPSAVSVTAWAGGDRWVNRVVPVGAQPVGQVGDGTVMADRSGHVWTVTDPKVAPAAVKLPNPAKKKKATPSGVIASFPGGFVYGWSGGDQLVLQRVSLTDPAHPRTVATVNVPASSAHGVTGVMSPGARLLVVGESVVSMASGKVAALPEGSQVQSVLDDRVYVSATGSAVTVVSATGARRSVQARQENGVQIGIPVAAAGSVGFVPATVGGRQRLYAIRLDAVPSSSPAPSSTSSHKPTKSSGKPKSTASKSSTSEPTKKASSKSSEHTTASHAPHKKTPQKPTKRKG